MSTVYINEEEQIISIKEARKIMGTSARKYTDEALAKLINELDMIAMLQLRMVPISKK